MIAMVSGPIAASGSDYVIVDTHGVGYMVYVPKPLLARLNDGDQVTLYTNLVVREDSLTLYGFESWVQRLLFDQLLAVSGIGPKVAMNLLSSLSPDDLRTALASGDAKTHAPDATPQPQGCRGVRAPWGERPAVPPGGRHQETARHRPHTRRRSGAGCRVRTDETRKTWGSWRTSRARPENPNSTGRRPWQGWCS